MRNTLATGRGRSRRDRRCLGLHHHGRRVRRHRHHRGRRVHRPRHRRTAASTAATAAATFSLRTGFVDDESATRNSLPLSAAMAFSASASSLNFRKAKAARLARKTIAKQRERIRLHAHFRKQRLHLLFRSLKREIAHVQFLHGDAPCPLSTRRARNARLKRQDLGPQVTTSFDAFRPDRKRAPQRHSSILLQLCTGSQPCGLGRGMQVDEAAGLHASRARSQW